MDESTRKMILVPAIVTLAVTLLRLFGELLGGPQFLFGTAGGGGGSLIGIVWLIPIFGVYFASGLCNRGQGPAQGGWKVALWALIGLVAAMAGAAATFSTLGSGPASVLVVGPLFLAIAFLIVRGAWPQLFSTLVFYGLSARIPVVIVAFLAMAGNWGTHYELGPPDFPEVGLLQKWFLLGLFPQLTFWVGFTVIIGTLFGGITAALKKA